MGSIQLELLETNATSNEVGTWRDYVRFSLQQRKELELDFQLLQSLHIELILVGLSQIVAPPIRK